MSETVRLGFVGAGSNSRQKHLPGFQKLAGVELAGVCNSKADTTAAVARQFGIKQTYSHWEQLIDDDSIDAVVIGTWPNLHCEITCAALAAGKHVLSEARMAWDLEQADQMCQAAQAHPDLVTMVVPSPFGIINGPYLSEIIENKFLGDLREVVVLGANDQFWDYSQFLHPRQSRELSGNNALTLGILHETVSRWIPATEQVFAQTSIFEPQRPVEDEPEPADVTVPDSVHVMTNIAGGARGLYHISGVCIFGPGLHIHLYGSEGTIKIRFDPQRPQSETVLTGRHGDDSLSQLHLPAERLGRWTVESDFLAAIHGQQPVTINSFDTARKYMEFTEAVHLSAEQNVPISLPLATGNGN